NSRHLTAYASGDAYRGIVNPQPGQGGHAMLDRFDMERSIAQTRSPRAFKDILNQRWDARLMIALFANEGDPRAGRRWGDGEHGLLAGKEPRAIQPDFARDCLLAIGHFGFRSRGL